MQRVVQKKMGGKLSARSDSFDVVIAIISCKGKKKLVNPIALMKSALGKHRKECVMPHMIRNARIWLIEKVLALS